jgi:hypothetical protein
MRVHIPIGFAAAALLVGASMAPSLAGVVRTGPVHMNTRAHALVAPGLAGRLVMQHVHVVGLPSWSKPNPDKKGGCLYNSLNLSTDVDMYSSASPYGSIGSLGAVGGWGVAASKKTVYVGNGSDDITGYTPCSTSTNGYTAHGNAEGVPYGLAADKKGNVWGDEWSTTLIDWWGPSGGAPAGSANETNQAITYFLALDKSDNVYPVGYNTSESAETLDKCSSTITGCTTLVSISGGFPGGDALDKKGNIYLNNQYGTLTSYTCSPTCTQTGSFTYSNGENPLDYTAIALDTKAQNIWGANIYFCSSSYGLCGDLQAQSVPLASATLGGATAGVDNDEPLGTAVYKPAKP